MPTPAEIAANAAANAALNAGIAAAIPQGKSVGIPVPTTYPGASALPAGWDDYTDNAMAGLTQAPTWTEFSPAYFSTLDSFDAKMAYLKATNPAAYAELHDTGFGGMWDKDINGNTLPAGTNYRAVLENRLNNWSLATSSGAHDALTYDEFLAKQKAEQLDPVNLVDPFGGTQDVIDLGGSIASGDIGGALGAGTDIAAPGLRPTISFAGDVAGGMPVDEALRGAIGDAIPGVNAYAQLADQVGQGPAPGATPLEPPWLPGSGPPTSTIAGGTAPTLAEQGPWTPLSRDDFAFQRIEDPWVTAEQDAARLALAQRAMNFTGEAAPTIAAGDEAALRAQFAQQGGDIGAIRAGADYQGQLAREMAAQRGLYVDAATGRVPSVAELQMRAGTDQALKAQLAAAKTARNAGAFYTAGQRGDDIMAQNIRDTAMLRASEMAQARGELAGYLGQEGTVRAGATEGWGTAAGAQNALTTQEQARLQRELDLQKARAENEISTRQANTTRELGLLSASQQADLNRIEALKGKSLENEAAMNASARFAESQAKQQQDLYATNVGATTSKYGTDVQSQTELEKARMAAEAQEKAAQLGFAGALGAGLFS